MGSAVMRIVSAVGRESEPWGRPVHPAPMVNTTIPRMALRKTADPPGAEDSRDRRGMLIRGREGSGRARRGRERGAHLRREAERHAGAAGGDRVRPQDAPVPDHQLTRQVQSHARTCLLLAKGRLSRRERLLERSPGDVAVHAGALVHHRNDDALVHDPRPDLDRPILGRVATGILQELMDDAVDPRLVRQREQVPGDPGQHQDRWVRGHPCRRPPGRSTAPGRCRRCPAGTCPVRVR